MKRLVAVLLYLSGGTSAQAEDSHAPYRQVDPSVELVETGGFWVHAGRFGHQRVVIHRRWSPERDHRYDTLYLEWLQVKGAKAKVIAVKQVKEIGEPTVVWDVSFVPTNEPHSIRVQIEHGGEPLARDGEPQATEVRAKLTKCLQLGEPGMYTAKDGPCAKASSASSRSPR